MISSPPGPPAGSRRPALALGAPAVALGQEVGPYDPLGIRAGGFLIYPSLSVSEVYDDNVFATDNNTDDDLITPDRAGDPRRIQFQPPSASGFDRRRRGRASTSTSRTRTTRTSSSRPTAGSTSPARISSTAMLEFARGHDSRDDPEDQGDRDELRTFNRYGSELSFTQLFNRINFRLTGRAVRTAYEETEDADRDEWILRCAAAHGLLRVAAHQHLRRRALQHRRSATAARTSTVSIATPRAGAPASAPRSI